MYIMKGFLRTQTFAMKKHSVEKEQLVSELHKPIRRNFERRHTIIKGIDDLWQADLAQLDYYSNSNKNYKFILVVIDCFSKYVWAQPLKSKHANEVAKAFESILAGKRRPKNLQTDRGTEFFNSKFKKIMVNHKIHHYSTFTSKKAAIVERVIRTLKGKLFKYFSLNGTYQWINILPEIVCQYNNTRHRTIGIKPIEVNKRNENHILKSVYSFVKVAPILRKNTFAIGEIVRISKIKHIFEKGYTPNWTTELFKIAKVQITNPVTYLLKDLEDNPIRGAFYQEELQKAKYSDIYLVEKVLKQRKNKLFVKWLGFDNRSNSWIDKMNKL